ncbi:hypothetical protein BH23GEM6_BH23GEM6_01390 [soil metagenome]
MPAAENEQLVRSYFSDISADYYSEDAELHDMSQAQPLRGREAIRGFLTMYLEEAFPEGAYQVNRVIADADGAAAEWTFRGLNQGPLMGVDATHRSVEFSGVSVYQIRDGRFTSARIYYDSGTLADQLGVLGQRLPRSEREHWQDWWTARFTK